jgi:flagellar FliJ protein
MKKFKFKFERLLNIKKIEEDRIKQELSRELSLLNEYMRERDGYIEELEKVYEMIRSQGGAVNISLMLISRDQISGYKNRIERVERSIKNQQEVVEKVKKKLAEAMKNRKIYEKLKENDKIEWKKEFEEYENMMLDEIGSRKKGLLDGDGEEAE